MTTTILYRAGRLLLRGVLWIYFRKVETDAPANLPRQGPVILAANHPHSIMDALVLALAVGRTVHFLAHSGLFRHRVRAFFLRQAGVIPVFRPSDEAQAGSHNVRTFQACADLLASGGCIGIFPEGTSQSAPRVLELRTGTARIALEAEAAYDFRLGVRVVPVGLNFESPGHFRSRVLVSPGTPIPVQDLRELYGTDPARAVRLLTAALAERMRPQVLHIERSELGGLVRQIDRMYRDEIDDHPNPVRTNPFRRRHVVTREIARAVGDLYDRQPGVVWSLSRRLQDYHDLLERSRLSDEMIRMRQDPSVQRGLLRLALLACLSLPLAMVGLLFNYLPYRLPGLGAKRLSTDPTKTHGFQMLLGIVVYLLYYPTLLYGAHRFLNGSWPWTLAFAASLLPSGLFARWFLYRLARERRMLRFAWFSTVHRALLLQARRMRRNLIDEMDGLFKPSGRSAPLE